jgi:alkylated DNA repair dioxygenase AlkB
MKNLQPTYSTSDNDPLVIEDGQIPSLYYVENYISASEEKILLRNIDRQKWDDSLKRRVQHYGYKYSYRNRQIDQSSQIGNIPNWLNDLSSKLQKDNIMPYKPNQIIINEYVPGQGIAPHIDLVHAFSGVICSLSLGSDCIMDFTREVKVSRILHKRSLLVLSEDARYRWMHSIAARKTDKVNGNILPRGRRVSITFRKVII